jgi:hypothetical protein
MHENKAWAGELMRLLVITLILPGFLCCVPFRTVEKSPPAPEPPPELPADFAAELRKLEDSLANAPSAKHEIHVKIFDLAVHIKNPGPDYEKALHHLLLALESGHGLKDSLHYLSWRRVLQELEQTRKKSDSLLNVSARLSRTNRAVSGRSNDQKRQIDSLTAKIKSQREIVNKLRKLDLQMEQKRRRIQ